MLQYFMSNDATVGDLKKKIDYEYENKANGDKYEDKINK